MVKKNGFYIEGTVKEHNGKFLVPVDHFKGEINSVMEGLAIKYAAKPKKGLIRNIEEAFDLAGVEMEKMVK
jgi:hypothetical protein